MILMIIMRAYGVEVYLSLYTDVIDIRCWASTCRSDTYVWGWDESNELVVSNKLVAEQKGIRILTKMLLIESTDAVPLFLQV